MCHISKTIILCVIILLQMSIVSASPSCVFIKFSDVNSYSKLDTSELLSDLIMEKVMNDKIFSVKECKKLGNNVDKMYIDNYEESTAFIEGERSGNFDAMFNDVFFGVKNLKKIYEAVEGDTVYPDVIKSISLSNNVSYIIHGTVKQAISYDSDSESDITFHNVFLSTLGAKENKVEIIAYIRVIDGKTGKVIWGKEIRGIGDKLNVTTANFTLGGKQYDSVMYYNAVNNVADIIVKKLNDDIKKGNLKLEDGGK